jgi:competence protein ComEC
VEGGQSTLIVTPERHTFLIDSGFPAKGGMDSRSGNPKEARDANRIVAAVHDAGLSRIDDLLITHFHPDHDGGVPELCQLLPIGTFIDHGSISPDAAANLDYKAAFDAYAAARESHPHLEPKAGERLPLKDLEITVVSSAGKTLASPMPGAGAGNAMCASAAAPAGDPYENPRSTGVLIRYGRFRFLDLGDLTGAPLFDLVCPKNLLGAVSVYLVAHHGGPDAADPATFAALKPQAAIVNNGQSKGGAAITLQALHRVATPMDVWQLHRSADAGGGNFADEYIANLDESTSHWIKLVARADGSFRIFNPRTRSWRDYAALE